MKKTIALRCLNEQCGKVTRVTNPMSAGPNNISYGNIGDCPVCNSPAQFEDWFTDSSGEIHWAGFFDLVHGTTDSEALRTLLETLESTAGETTADDLINALQAVNPEFEKYRGFITLLSPEKMTVLLAMLVPILALMIQVLGYLDQQESTQQILESQQNSQAIQQQQLNVQREQLDILKRNANEQNEGHEKIEREIRDLKHQIKQMKQAAKDSLIAENESDAQRVKRPKEGL